MRPRSGDPLLERSDQLERFERLERLAQRRHGAAGGPPITGSTLPPPSATSARQPKRTKRHHPAKTARMGALVVSCVTTGGLTYLFAGINESQAGAQSLAALPTPVSTGTQATATTSTQTVPTTSAATAPTASTQTASTAATAASTVQAFNGDAIDTRYGPVQVQVQITDGAISEVAVVQYPDFDGKSVRINSRALPTLRSEALTAQSANIDTVSGATYTSEAYARSLQAAIDQARAAGVTTLA
jgi:uncharacterized protein with FMN-binding domain